MAANGHTYLSISEIYTLIIICASWFTVIKLCICQNRFGSGNYHPNQINIIFPILSTRLKYDLINHLNCTLYRSDCGWPWQTMFSSKSRHLWYPVAGEAAERVGYYQDVLNINA